MPESRTRKKSAYTAPQGKSTQKPNPRWFLPLALGLMIVGLIWIVVYYLTQAVYPIQAIGSWQVGSWNLVIGFGLIMIGFGMLTRWR